MAIKRLNERGQCCGRKPIVYKRAPAHLFCPRCDAAYDPATGMQIENWAYRADGTLKRAATVTFKPKEEGK